MAQQGGRPSATRADRPIHSSRWPQRAGPDPFPEVGHGGRMHPQRRAATLIAAALITASCVSVPHQPPKPEAPTPTTARRPALPPWPDQQPVGREELSAASPDKNKPRKPPPAPVERKEAPPPRQPAARPPAERHNVPARPARPRHVEPAAPRRPQQPPPPDMRTLCRKADGVANPAIVELCRGAYGR